MEVQTYVEKEKESLISDPGAWLTKVKELGLEEQASIIEREDQKPNPFLKMDKGLVNILTTLCPSREEIKKFKAEPIPYEALGMYSLAIHEDYFETVEIWHNPQDNDPFMVGVIKTGPYSWEKDYYLMARWGLEKVSFEQLKKKAREIWITDKIVYCKKQVADYTQKLGSIEALADNHMNGNTVNI